MKTLLILSVVVWHHANFVKSKTIGVRIGRSLRKIEPEKFVGIGLDSILIRLVQITTQTSTVSESVQCCIRLRETVSSATIQP